VLYGDEREIGQKVKEGDVGWEKDKEIYKGGLPPDLQYLWVKYDPVGYPFPHKIDFTWEREWRLKFPNPLVKQEGLPVGIRNPWSHHQGAIVVAKEAEIVRIRSCIEDHRQAGAEWATYVGRIVSLEKAREKLEAEDQRYAKLETSPDNE
jgi:hypothetical protein